MDDAVLLGCTECRALLPVAADVTTLPEHGPEGWGCPGSGQQGIPLGPTEEWASNVYVGAPGGETTSMICEQREGRDGSVRIPPDGAWRQRRALTLYLKCPVCGELAGLSAIRESNAGQLIHKAGDQWGW